MTSHLDPHQLRTSEVSRAAGAVVVAAAAASFCGRVHHSAHHGWWTMSLILVLIAILVIVGNLAVRWTAKLLGRFVTRRTVEAAGAIVRFAVTSVGYVVLFIGALAMAGVSWQRLLIGAGLVSVVIGIAAQQSLSNIFASFVLLFGRTFNVGDRIIIRSGGVGTLECVVRAISLTYVTVETDTGLIKIPNSVLSGAAIGKLPPLES